MLEAAARRIRHGVWRDREGMALWWSLMDDLLSKHEMAYAEWNTRNGAAHPGFGDGVQEISKAKPCWISSSPTGRFALPR